MMISQLEKSTISRHIPTFDFLVSRTLFLYKDIYLIYILFGFFYFFLTMAITKKPSVHFMKILLILLMLQVKEAISYIEHGLSGPEFEK